MDMEKDQKFQANSNIFNWVSSSGGQEIWYLSKYEIRARLLIDLLFVDSLFIPSTSFLCNPATEFMLKEDQEFMDYLLKSGKIIPVLLDNTSFPEQMEKLYANKSPAVINRPRKDIKETAKKLHKYVDMGAGFPIKQAELNNEKTATSKQFLRNLRDILPQIGPYCQDIKEQFKREEDEKKFLSGSSWINLPKNVGEKKLHAFTTELSEIGTMVLDFSYAKLTQSSLIGHSYRQNMHRIGDFTRSFLPAIEIQSTPKILDIPEENIDTVIFDKNLLSKINLKTFKILDEKGTKNKYIEAMKNLRAQPSEEQLLKVKIQLDKYLRSLSKIIKSTELINYAKILKRSRNVRTKLELIECSNKFIAVISTMIGAAVKSVITGTLPYVFFCGETKLTEELLKGLLSKKKEQLNNMILKYNELKDKERPVRLQLNMKTQ